MVFLAALLYAGEDARVLNAGSGGVICVDACRTPGAVVMTFNSEGMFRGWGVLRRALLRTSAEEGSAEGSAQGSAGGSEKGSDKGSDKGGELLLQRQAQVGIWQEMKDVCVPVEVAPGTLLREINPKDARSMQRVGQLRFQVWEAESAINAELFPGRCWLDPLDTVGRHWVLEDALTGAWIATARLTLHPTLEDENRDLQLWQRCGKVLPVPTVDLGRLVVLSAYRGRGLAQLLNTTRIAAARAMGARSIVVTASEGNVRLLKKLGFEDIGETVYFEDWPNACFYALQLNL